VTPIPADVRQTIVEALAQALVADWRRRHADPEPAEPADDQGAARELEPPPPSAKCRSLR